MGGSVAAGQPYLVGEKGAELFVPNQSGNIVPNNQMAATGGTNINFTIQATDTSGFDQLLTSRKNQIVAMISQAMNQRGKTGLI
jgi:phage-related minor tail protein